MPLNPKKKQKSTVRAEKEERERIKRLASKQKTFNGIIFDDETTDLDQALTDSLTAGRSVKALLLDECEGKKVEVNPSLVHHLKEHQMTGVQFLYNCAIESLNRLDMPGSGAILAHCKLFCISTQFQSLYLGMGLGKSLTTIAFVHTIMTHPLMDKKFNRILIVCPKNVVYHWNNEFSKWIYKNNQITSKIAFLKIDTENQKTCSKIFKTWFEAEHPTVIIIGYEKLRRLLMGEVAKPKNKSKELSEAEKKELEDMRAEFKKYLQDPGPDLIICDEAHTVKPNLIGSVREFKHRFVIPIRNGQTIDATDIDLKTMRQRCFILFNKLKGTIDRRNYNTLSQFLKPKHEYILQLRMTPKQLAMYKLFLSTSCDTTSKRARKLFLNHHTFCRILLHPYQPITNWEQKMKKKPDEKCSSSDEDDEAYNASTTQTDEQSLDGANVDAPNPWFKDSGILTEEDRDNFELSYKLMFLIETIKECEAVGDKMLVFSKSLSTLGLICRMLESMSATWFDDKHEVVLMNSNERWGWVKNKDYMLINGSISCKDRNVIQDRFNKQVNWNLLKKIGQSKPVYVYRLVGYGTIEDRIYMRQVTKESIASRVIDERQVKRHYKHSDMNELYKLEVSEYDATKPLSYVPSEDPLLASVVSKLKEAVVNILKHESLLKHIEEEVLNEEEEKEAWTKYREIENANNKTQVNAATDQPSTSASTDQNGQAPADNTGSV
ncbi:SNF2 family N-terminal domain containing protein [Aphelenchoides bicaudatus]|nr:SNF2 family N-terminal domain containing protein [Aphelenchoides bicaudatus]